MIYIIDIIILTIICSVGYFFYKKKLDNLDLLIKKYETKNNELEDEKKTFNEEQESLIQSLCEEIKEVDTALTIKTQDILSKNTVQFECPCEHQIITMVVDLSKDKNGNTYTCPECGNEYILNISLVPTLKEKIIDERVMYRLLTEKYNDIHEKESN